MLLYPGTFGEILSLRIDVLCAAVLAANLEARQQPTPPANETDVRVHRW